MAGQAAHARSPGEAATLAEMYLTVSAATASATAWGGPRSGPPGVPGKLLAVVCEDLRNGGVQGVAQGIGEAAKVMQWQLRLHDAGGTPAGRRKALADALAARPDGVALVGMDAADVHASLIPFAEQRTPIVGWHVGPKAGRMADGPVAMNVSTDPLEVARISAMAAVVDAKGKAGVVIFTDSNFGIALAKSRAMADVIRACRECTLLDVRDLAISRSHELMPAATRELLERHGRRWTHALAINDLYFDYAVPELTQADLAPNALSLLSAGDGSNSAFLRIRARTFQIGTVAEPLNLHGWQVVDELNRLFAGRPVTGYVVPVHLVTAGNVGFDGGDRLLFDPDNGYREFYRRIWKR